MENQSLEDFNKTIRKAFTRKTAKVRGSWGVYDCYKLLRKKQWYNIGRPLKEHEFYTIIRSVNKHLAEAAANGETIIFPYRMGKLELRKFERGVSLVNGKLKINYPINWEDTIRLWFEDKEAKKNKTLLRREEKYVYHMRYSKYNANYENQSFYEFDVNRFIKKALKENIQKGKIDTLW